MSEEQVKEANEDTAKTVEADAAEAAKSEDEDGGEVVVGKLLLGGARRYKGERDEVVTRRDERGRATKMVRHGAWNFVSVPCVVKFGGGRRDETHAVVIPRERWDMMADPSGRRRAVAAGEGDKFVEPKDPPKAIGTDDEVWIEGELAVREDDYEFVRRDGTSYRRGNVVNWRIAKVLWNQYFSGSLPLSEEIPADEYEVYDREKHGEIAERATRGGMRRAATR